MSFDRPSDWLTPSGIDRNRPSVTRCQFNCQLFVSMGWAASLDRVRFTVLYLNILQSVYIHDRGWPNGGVTLQIIQLVLLTSLKDTITSRLRVGAFVVGAFGDRWGSAVNWSAGLVWYDNLVGPPGLFGVAAEVDRSVSNRIRVVSSKRKGGAISTTPRKTDKSKKREILKKAKRGQQWPLWNRNRRWTAQDNHVYIYI